MALKIETQTHEDHQIKLIVETDDEMLNKYMQRAAREISQKARVPGFRPGKVPYDVIKRLYGDKAIESQAVEIMVDDVYPEALKEANIEPSGPGKLEEIPSSTPPRFVFIVPLKPEVQLFDYALMRKDYNPEPVSEDSINAVLRQLRINNAVTQPVDDRPAQENDMLKVVISARLLNPDEGDETEIIKDQSLEIVIDPQGTPEDAPFPYAGFSRDLIGLSANEEKALKYSYGTNAIYEKLKNKDVEFTVKVDSIMAIQLPEVNDEFAQSLGEYETIDALLSSIRSHLEQEHQQAYDDEYLGSLIEEIVKQSTVRYPPHMLDEEVEHVLRSVESNLGRRGLDLPTYLKTINSDRETYIENEIKPMAKKQLEKDLVLQQMMIKEKIKVSPEELQSAVSEMLQQIQRYYSDQKMAKKQLNDMASAAYYDTANRLLNRNLMLRIKAIAIGEYKEEAPATEPIAESSPEQA